MAGVKLVILSLCFLIGFSSTNIHLSVFAQVPQLPGAPCTLGQLGSAQDFANGGCNVGQICCVNRNNNPASQANICIPGDCCPTFTGQNTQSDTCENYPCNSCQLSSGNDGWRCAKANKDSSCATHSNCAQGATCVPYTGEQGQYPNSNLCSCFTPPKPGTPSPFNP